MPQVTRVRHKPNYQGVQLTDFLRERLYPCVVLHNSLTFEQFTGSDLGLCSFRKLEKVLDAPSALGVVKRYNRAIGIAIVMVHPQRMLAEAEMGYVKNTTYPERTSMN
jgi:hypothetical protein